MAKLIELLNKAQNDAHLFGHYIGDFEWKYYAKNHWRLIIDTLGYTDAQYETFDYSDRDICGKDGGFIKRLVENDKIDKKKINKLIKGQEVWYGYEVQEEEYYSIYESLLMLLSISDEPISDLISYLR